MTIHNSNETGDNNTIIDDNEQTDLDVDNDGIIDSQDNCLDTKPRCDC